jgi:hypothetical protein
LTRQSFLFFFDALSHERPSAIEPDPLAGSPVATRESKSILDGEVLGVPDRILTMSKTERK